MSYVEFKEIFFTLVFKYNSIAFSLLIICFCILYPLLNSLLYGSGTQEKVIYGTKHEDKDKNICLGIGQEIELRIDINIDF